MQSLLLLDWSLLPTSRALTTLTYSKIPDSIYTSSLLLLSNIHLGS